MVEMNLVVEASFSFNIYNLVLVAADTAAAIKDLATALKEVAIASFIFRKTRTLK